MSVFPIHTLASAPAASQRGLRALNETFGFIPNVAGAMAESPVLLDAFLDVFRAVHAGSFAEAQIQTLLLTNAVTNGSAWPVAFHSALARRQGVSEKDVEAMREGRDPSDPTLAPLSALARHLIERRGQTEPAALQRFIEAGHARADVLELILVIAASTLTNYVAGVARPPLEPDFELQAWRPLP